MTAGRMSLSSTGLLIRHGLGKGGGGAQASRIAKRYISTAQLDAAKGDRERVVILGSGWAGFGLSRSLDTRYFQPVVISPRNYFVFTPLLASAAVGTLEPRVTMEMVRGRSAPSHSRLPFFRGKPPLPTPPPHSGIDPSTTTPIPVSKGVEYYQGWADKIDFIQKQVHVEEAFGAGTVGMEGTGQKEDLKKHSAENGKKGKMFTVGYDKLVIAVGCYAQTFGIKGVKQNAWFLKDVADARGIRRRVLECFELASLPTTNEEEKRKLLHFAIVGGGPTGIEFAAELHDLISDDLPSLYPTLVPLTRISVYDVAPRILSMFDANLANYAERVFARQRITIKTQHHVLEVKEGPVLVTKEEGEVPAGMVVWSTGLAMNPFVERVRDVCVDESGRERWEVKKDKKAGRLCIDERLRVQIVKKGKDNGGKVLDERILPDVFALGDCAYLAQQSRPHPPPPPPPSSHQGKAPQDTKHLLEDIPHDLPATAQVANQQANYLRHSLNKAARNNLRLIAPHPPTPTCVAPHPSSSGQLAPVDITPLKPFHFRNLGVMAYLGGWRAITQIGGGEGGKPGKNGVRKREAELKGRLAWLLWRTAYLSMSVSWRNRILIPMYWFVNWIFGRDLNRF